MTDPIQQHRSIRLVFPNLFLYGTQMFFDENYVVHHLVSISYGFIRINKHIVF